MRLQIWSPLLQDNVSDLAEQVFQACSRSGATCLLKLVDSQ
jgi:hypothetical protein